ncbi:MAG: TetR/AcrR family transcriptional regulator [Planctomycetes bacterium]|nr:TetR/AcrR family transcriptional regulator [Planctomycetota bacterium]
MATRTRKSSAERRKEIAKAVLHIIGRRGLTSLTMSTLAAEIGVTSGALFRHFETRDDILREVVRHGVAKIDRTFPDKSLPPLERLFTLARNRIRLLGPDPGLAWLLRSEQAYLTLPKDAVNELRDVARRSRRFLLKAIRDGAADGSIRSDIPPEVLLVPIIGTIHTLIGTPGASQHAQGKQHRNTSRVLAALERMIIPPGSAES